MFYSAAWCTDTEEDFKQKLPLDLLAESIGRFNSRMGFSIVILDGIEKLSRNYLDELCIAGLTIIDYGQQFKHIIRQFPNIDKRFNHYERNCFLRWIAFREIVEASSRHHQQFWHMDIDVVLHTSLDDLADDTRGKTFVLQGCPVFVSVSDLNWFKAYEENLVEFDRNIETFSNNAAALKEVCVQNDMKLGNVSLFRNPIGSDQDLLEFLVSSQRIPQQLSTEIFNSRYYFIQNPLSLSTWHHLQKGTGFSFQAGSGSRIIINRKIVPFIHYQNNFVLYASIFLTLKKLHVPERVMKGIMKYNIRDEQFKTSTIFKIIAKLSRARQKYKERMLIVQEFIEGNNTNRIVALLNFLVAQEE